ncbi:diguanylate cyclase [Vibrio makurazakiensis]|uniref:diguanylate cyclase n=1 Tax=Vibrio makurazakiensis TaxID=2910250 RepID=UPI003D0F1E4C
MKGSIYRKLHILFISSFLLVAVITASWWYVLEKHEKAQKAISEVIQVQRSVDLLRSQLWVFLQFGDQVSLNAVLEAQKDLSDKLDACTYLGDEVDNIKTMNNGLVGLIDQESKLIQQHNMRNFVANSDSRNVIQAITLLHSRYNMIVQNMVDELFHLQKALLLTKAEEQKNTLVTSAIQILAFAILVLCISTMILRRFRVGCRTIRKGIKDLGSGNMNSRVGSENLDSEFVVIANTFNQMKESLQQTTVTKDELEREVKRQTSKLEKQKEQLTFLSERDPLTGLFNRRACKQMLEEASKKAKRSKLNIALLFLDLDKFKLINDCKGHEAGDEVLRYVASRLSQNIRESDFVGRIGGDEFVVCLDLLDTYDGVDAKAKQLVELLREPMIIGGEAVSVGVSIGISLYPKHTTDIACMFKLADAAMYKAKRSQSHTYFCHSSIPEEVSLNEPSLNERHQ